MAIRGSAHICACRSPPFQLYFSSIVTTKGYQQWAQSSFSSDPHGRTFVTWKTSLVIVGIVLYRPVCNNLTHTPEVLSATPSLPESLWNFSRYKNRAHITFAQNLHFYFALPSDESAFMPGFFLSPIENIWLDRQLPDTIYVLVDRPGRVFLETKPVNRNFGNVWKLNGFLIFKGCTMFLCLVSSSDLFPDTSFWGAWGRTAH